MCAVSAKRRKDFSNEIIQIQRIRKLLGEQADIGARKQLIAVEGKGLEKEGA